MKWDIWNRALAVLAAAALIIHFWPMAYWNGGTIVTLRITAAFCTQLLFCRIVRHDGLRLLPLALTGLLALWGGWLFLTSPAWRNATLPGYIGDYCAPMMACAAAYVLWQMCRKRGKQ